ncbi:PspA/IM30 family protein [Paenibacillus radicis (ex Xue et al. 2023)]|uniref:PspA/IM30 family protein n=1 Tax=Paenibacillus radicis (ex Xue et al. 2023) TaxID=2972489 RepID=A0ABT1YSQ0_9BACL|nr:PspA/IM30 family protein [Paenibacillus radicis (ex Xue et al. 2023)]MCR8636213.1 PspA/IM30 family protein [Paenibacillus radicis (ex Xue et al. 2023)]
MGILSRLKDIMKVNVNSLLERNDDPEKTIDEYMRTLNSDLGKVKSETASVLSDERRAQTQLDECNAEIKKLQRYAEKSVEAGNEDDALKFLERKAKLGERLTELQAAYDLASTNAANMKQMQDKLISDLGQLETRRIELKGKLAAAKLQQGMNSGHSSTGDVQASFRAMEERADQALNEAEALAELRAGTKEDDLDTLLAQLEKNSDAHANTASLPKPEDELASLQAKIKKE